MAGNPAFMANPRMEVATLSAANPNYDGTGTIVPLITAAAAGTRITKIQYTGSGSNNTNFGYLVIYYTNDNGTTWRYLDSLYIGTWSVAVDAPPSSSWNEYADLVLEADPANVKLGCALTFAPETPIHVYAFGGDF